MYVPYTVDSAITIRVTSISDCTIRVTSFGQRMYVPYTADCTIRVIPLVNVYVECASHCGDIVCVHVY